MSTPKPADHHLGTVLVALQFALLALLVWLAAGGLQHRGLTGSAISLAAAGVALGLWALSANRPGNFNIHPTPHEEGRLVTAGPYRWIRHPMYSALLLAGAAAVSLSGFSAMAWAALAALFGVLWAKSTVEERAMVAKHPAYAGYRQTTWRFAPWVF